MAALTEEAGRVLSHYRPEPQFVEVTRTAAALCTGFVFSVEGPRAVRSLVTLRRLPPAPPNTMIRAVATVFGAIPEILRADGSVLGAMCTGDEPFLAGVANAVAGYLHEYRGEPERALAAAECMLAAVEHQPAPWMRLLAHARIGDLCLQAGQGERAMPHLRSAMRELEQLGERSETLGVRLGMVLANLQLGAVDEAERLLALVEPEQPDDALDARTFGLTVRAEIMLARDQIDGGLRLWRRAADLLRETIDRGDVPGYDAWTLEVEAATVIAHVRHGRLDLVGPLAAALPDRLSTVLATLAGSAQPYQMSFPVCGALLLALATVELDRGATVAGIRLTALAERFTFIRGFRPVMCGPRVRDEAERADKAAYADAVSEYAALARHELPAAALAALPDPAHA
jgi:hypothetical protein